MKRTALLLGLMTTVMAFAATQGAAARPFNHATGEIWMTEPSQYASFSAFDYGPSSPADRGTLTYENFDYPGGLAYTADVLCATVSPANHWARFMFQIPAGFPGLSGLYVVVEVTDGGSPGVDNDTWGHTATADLAMAQTWCESGTPGVTNYEITAGNLVVHR